MLGGKTKERIPVCEPIAPTNRSLPTTLRLPHQRCTDCTTARPDLAQGLGFVGAKYPLAYGPADGDAGLRKNVEIHQKWRDAVGPDYPLMIDCCAPAARARVR